jgi:hypothetical protein
VTESLIYALGDTVIPKAIRCKYLGIISSRDLSWADEVSYTATKAWKALHYIMRIFKKGNSNTKSLAYTSLVRPILEYASICWGPYSGGETNSLYRVQTKRLNLHMRGMI